VGLNRVGSTYDRCGTITAWRDQSDEKDRVFNFVTPCVAFAQEIRHTHLGMGLQRVLGVHGPSFIISVWAEVDRTSRGVMGGTLQDKYANGVEHRLCCAG
jgi:hypothetical protein